MLKITHDSPAADILRVNLYGLFTAEYVTEVEKLLAQNKNAKRLAVDLTNVTFVDRAAMEFLRAALSRNIKLENLPSWINRWIQQEARKGVSSLKVQR